MNVLVIGSGGREHALALKLVESALVEKVFVAPGNGGTASGAGGAIENIPLKEGQFAELIAFAKENGVGLTVVGPEAPLVDGVVDAFDAAGLPCFGPSKLAAELEGSKAFSKAFMDRHGIPTARWAVFPDAAGALAHLDTIDYDVVIKASGLAAGKGVIVCDSLDEAREAVKTVAVDRAFGDAGDEVLVEERLYGQEASILAFSDGERVVPMVSSQDHKPALDGDKGPNTGGMGAYAPAPIVTPDILQMAVDQILVPTITGMAAEGRPYKGVLYAGLMITKDGPKVLEFNCRFGDPETQVVLPMLDGDLAAILLACAKGELDPASVRTHDGAAVTVVAASGGYPGSYPKGLPITGLDAANALDGVHVVHAGTRREGDELVTSGGRVLAVTALAGTLKAAIDQAYAGIEAVTFEGMHFRTDIGAKALK